MVRVRFAPSPTGNLHLGTLRAALFNWLFARNQKGTFVLRIEDTDLERSKPEYERSIIDGLNWLGMTVDEGPDQSGDYGPYRQSERITAGIYRQYAQQLLDKGVAYYCFDTPEELDAEREAAKTAGIPYKYSGKWRNVDESEVNEQLAAKKPYTIRYKIPEQQYLEYTDTVRGKLKFDLSLISDFVILKEDGSPTYNFAVVVDDMLMQISHVIRGEDHISNTPRQLALYAEFSAKPPEMVHLPMILGPDRSKLSKRHGATNVLDYQTAGYLPSALLNSLILLGWSPKTKNEVMTIDEMITQFNLDGVSKSNSIFDHTKLKWMNGQHIRKLDAATLGQLSKSFLTEHNQFSAEHERFNEMAATFQDNLQTLTDINDYIGVYFLDDGAYKAKVNEFEFSDTDLKVLTQFKMWYHDNSDQQAAQIQAQFKQIQTDLDLKTGQVLKPIRFAITAYKSGPNLADCIEILGVKTVQERLEYIVEKTNVESV